MLRRRVQEAGAAGKMAAERSRSPIEGFPVPACIFAPEPSSPGGAAQATASSRPHRAAFGSDCSEDGEVLNGEPELDLTSKVGPGGGDVWLLGRPSRFSQRRGLGRILGGGSATPVGASR